MIVGNGLIASAFSKARFQSDRHVIFASGVSNSLETDSTAYQRELSLVKSHIAKNTTFIYFSTTSIFDPTKQETIYIGHKKEIEALLKNEATSYIIVRLPIMVGRSNNPNTLINFLVEAILKQKPIQLHRNACRHLLDIDDLFTLLRPYFKNDPVQLQLNIPGSEKIMIPDLIREIEDVLKMHGKYTWVDHGSCYDIPENEGDCIYIDDDHYVQKLIRKYFNP